METLALAGGIGMQELLLILAILILLFGATRIPGIARALGKSIKEFKKGQQEGDKDDTLEKDNPGDGKL